LKFFKLYFNQLVLDGRESEKLINFDLLEVNYIQKEAGVDFSSGRDAIEDYKYNEIDLSSNKIGFKSKYLKSVDLEFEKKIELGYSLDFKLCFAIFGIFFKRLCLEKEKINGVYRNGKIVMGVHDLYEFFTFLKKDQRTLMWKTSRDVDSFMKIQKVLGKIGPNGSIESTQEAESGSVRTQTGNFTTERPLDTQTTQRSWLSEKFDSKSLEKLKKKLYQNILDLKANLGGHSDCENSTLDTLIDENYRVMEMMIQFDTFDPKKVTETVVECAKILWKLKNSRLILEQENFLSEFGRSFAVDGQQFNLPDVKREFALRAEIETEKESMRHDAEVSSVQDKILRQKRELELEKMKRELEHQTSLAAIEKQKRELELQKMQKDQEQLDHQSYLAQLEAQKRELELSTLQEANLSEKERLEFNQTKSMMNSLGFSDTKFLVESRRFSDLGLDEKKKWLDDSKGFQQAYTDSLNHQKLQDSLLLQSQAEETQLRQSLAADALAAKLALEDRQLQSEKDLRAAEALRQIQNDIRDTERRNLLETRERESAEHRERINRQEEDRMRLQEQARRLQEDEARLKARNDAEYRRKLETEELELKLIREKELLQRNRDDDERSRLRLLQREEEEERLRIKKRDEDEV
jgi:hypothetical protein